VPSRTAQISLLDGVIRRHSKERSGGFGALNIGKCEGALAETGIVADNLYHGLQIRGIPLLVDHGDGVGVSNLSCGNDAGIASTLSGDAADRLGAQIFFL